MVTRSVLLGLATLIAAPALAAGPDLAVAITAPAGTYVYDTGRYQIEVSNVGNKTASGTVLTITLPLTHTSPQVFVMGTLGAMDGRCARSGNKLVCNLGSVARGARTTAYFDIALPQSAAPLVVGAAATTTSGDANPANNSDTDTAALLHDAVAVSGGDGALNEHCTGTGLTSFFECEQFPSSISWHDTVLEADGSITFPNNPGPYTGTWSQPAADRLVFSYYDDGALAATFSGWGVSETCFEGMTTFPGSTYVSPYSVCLQ